MDVPAIVSADAAWVTESTLQVNVTFSDGSVEPVTVLVPPPPSLQPPWDPDYDTDIPPDA
jgi:hypothetical protein